MWWKGRTHYRNYNIENNTDLKCKPLSIAEQEMAYWEQTSEGLRIYTKVEGFGGSSTRTELAAGILAVSAYGGVHIGSDSRAFVTKPNKYIRMINMNRKPKRAWKLVSDGDLWQHFYEAVEAKGAHAVRLTWVKGHANEEHIASGITTQTNKAGNDEADKIADIGSELQVLYGIGSLSILDKFI